MNKQLIAIVGDRLERWSLDNDSLSADQICDLVHALVCSVDSPFAATLWHSIPQEVALEVLEFDGENCGWPLTALGSVLDKLQPHLAQNKGVRSHWRALRMIAGSPPNAVSEAFRDDLSCDDVVMSGNALSVIDAVLQARGGEYRRTLGEFRDRLPLDDPRRERLTSILERRSP